VLNKSVAELILEQLQAWGVKRIYGVVGDAILGLMDAIAKQDQIQFIAVKHESVAAMMASAEAKLTGKLGVCTATMGPGLGNLINGLGDAYLDKVPVLAITGQALTKKIGTDYKQYIDQQEFIKPLATYSTLLVHPDSVTDVMTKAMHLSLVKGAVTHISVPKDLFTMPSSGKVQKPATVIKGSFQITEQERKQVVNVMKSSKQPMILAGVGAKNAVQEVEELAETWGAGILVSLGAKGYFTDKSPYFLGGIGQGGNPYAKDVFPQADVVLLVGDTWWPEDYVPNMATVIQIEVMRENIGKGVPVQWGLFGSAEDVVPLLRKELQGHVRNEKWVKKVTATKHLWDQKNEEEGQISGSPIHPSRIVRALERTVQPDAVITLDTGDVTVWMNRNFRPHGQWFVFSGNWRTMGFGLPAALAAKLCMPDKQVVAVVGDGGIEMALADLLTATKYQLNIAVVIFNNQALQMERDNMIVNGFLQEGVKLTNPDFVKIAEACGWRGYRIDSEENIEANLHEAFNLQSPVLIDISTAPVVHPETKKE
jgi:pyruvate oxidase